jgi:putative membrane protein
MLILSEWSAERIYLAQLVVFLVALCVLAPLRVALFPARRRRALAHRAALEQFTVRGLSRGPARNGALIYVSLAERYARIIADDGAAGAIPQRQWQAIVDALLADMKAGAPADALIAAAGRCADALAAHYPPGETARPGSHFHIV